MNTQLLRNRPAYTLDRETAPAMWLVGTLWLIQATGIQTNNRSTFLEQLMPRGLGPPTHRRPMPACSTRSFGFGISPNLGPIWVW